MSELAWIMVFFAWVMGTITGSIARVAWMERRHDCLPHDSKRCSRHHVGLCMESTCSVFENMPDLVCSMLAGHRGAHRDCSGASWIERQDVTQ